MMTTTQRDMINDLSAQLEEAESARDEQGGLVDGLEEVRPSTSLRLFGRSTDCNIGGRETS